MTESVETIVVEGEGLTVSLLVWNRFKRPMPGLVDRVLDLNRGLSDLGLFLPVGTAVRIPIPSPRPVEVVEPVRLWDY